MALGPSTGVVNGQRFTFPTSAAYGPVGYGPQTAGVPQISPTMPPFIGGGGGASGGLGTADAANTTNSIAAGMAPWNWKVSPVIWAVVGLVLSIWLIQKIHWRETMLEGAERANVGPVRESAEVAA